MVVTMLKIYGAYWNVWFHVDDVLLYVIRPWLGIETTMVIFSSQLLQSESFVAATLKEHQPPALQAYYTNLIGTMWGPPVVFVGL